MNEPGTNAAESLWQQGLAEFRDATASASPVPGGGSVAAVSGALGVGLIIMGLEISANRKDAAAPDAIRGLAAKARGLLAGISAAADEDVRAFRNYMAALKLPKESAEEKAARRAAMDAACLAATQAPLDCAQQLLAALRLAVEALPLTHDHVVSDLGAGTSLLHGALRAVLYNVDINLPGIRDTEQRAAWAGQRAQHEHEAAELTAAVLPEVSRRLTGS